MALSYEVKEFSTFGKCVCIENGAMELYVTVIIYLYVRMTVKLL